MTAREILRDCILEARELCESCGLVQEDSVRAMAATLFIERQKAGRVADMRNDRQQATRPQQAPQHPADLGTCRFCGAANTVSVKTGKVYCSAMCWKKKD
jgi:hypothetical protein